MYNFSDLLACAGTWRGRNSVKVSADEPPVESDSQIIVTPMLNGSFVRIDQTWSWKDQPQTGSMLIGYEPKSAAATMHWIDTWHNGTRVMPLAGQFNSDGLLVLLGYFQVKDSPDWGWRIELRAAADHLKIDMFCITPAGKDEGGVTSAYSRA